MREGAIQTFLGFDYGLKRTGVASGNILTRTATPQATIGAEGVARFPLIHARIREWLPDALVVGIPFHPDGASHDNTLRAQKFARQLPLHAPQQIGIQRLGVKNQAAHRANSLKTVQE